MTALLDPFVAVLRQERAARRHAHRPWPPPRRSWLMAQSWVDLLFAHWSVPVAVLERLVPPQLRLDTFDGRAWIGITPFEVRNLRLRGTLPVPILSAFAEINVRTYVAFNGRPGIFFFSLDAASAPAVWTARRAYRLPYFHATMAIEREGERVSYASRRRTGEPAGGASFRASYRPLGGAAPAHAGTLEHWLTERYCLYTLGADAQVLTGEINHPPWPLQSAEADIRINTMTDWLGVRAAGEPLLHYAARQDVVFWALQPAHVVEPRAVSVFRENTKACERVSDCAK